MSFFSANQTNHSHISSPSNTDYIICGCLYIPFLILVVVFTVWEFLVSHASCCEHGDNLVIFSKAGLRKICGVLLCIVFGVRMIWLFLKPTYDPDCKADLQEESIDVFWCDFLRFLNRLSMLLQITTVFLILTAWMLGVGGGSPNPTRNNRLRIGFAAINAVLYLVVFCTSFGFTDTGIYLANNIIIATASILTSLAMLVVGLTCVARRLRQMTKSVLVQKQFRCVVVVALLCMLAYVLRTGCFVYGALYIEGKVPQNLVVYPWLFYPVPDIIIGCAVVGLLMCQPRARNRRSRREENAVPGAMAAANAYSQKLENTSNEHTRLLN